MTIDEKDMINSILESVSRIDYIKPEDIPNIDLYILSLSKAVKITKQKTTPSIYPRNYSQIKKSLNKKQ